MKLGVCYYPEHWPEQQWSDDARIMFEHGIEWVRIAEFAWSRIEPGDGDYQLEWLDRAIDTLAEAGLKLILGTPTATPPKWLIDKYPEILAVGADGQTRGFGSRRHYCFSSEVYRRECQRIVSLMAERYARHPAVQAWQTDNEYGCHDTIFSYSSASRSAFQRWCQARYTTINALNEKWGNVFWSMEYRSFNEIELPIAAVTETNPAHRIAFWRFSSDQVKSFNKLQCDILREHAPQIPLIHNFMGNFVDFDHFAVAEDLDVASWDNYPLGFLDRDGDDANELERWYRTGHPDSSALHHDLYRGVGRGRWWVMEQQPGPVNWAPHNPSPLPGMVRLWGWEAYAHGAEVMSYFRWRQAPFAQEQTHSGLFLPDGSADDAAFEVKQLSAELQQLANHESVPTASVALVFDYASTAMHDIIRLSGDGIDAFSIFKKIYTALRRCGINLDIVSQNDDLSTYRLIVIPGAIINDPAFVSKLENTTGHVVLMPGCGSRSSDFSMQDSIAPGALRRLIDVRITRSESLPPQIALQATTEQGAFECHFWRERVESSLNPAGVFDDGWGFHYRSDRFSYLNAILDDDSMHRFFRTQIESCGIQTRAAIEGVRYRQNGSLMFAFNFGPNTVELGDEDYLLGSSRLAPADLAAWTVVPG